MAETADCAGGREDGGEDIVTGGKIAELIGARKVLGGL